MKKYFLLLSLLAFTVIASAQNELVIDPNAELRTVNGGFSSIKVSGGFDLYLSQSNEETIAVSASEERFKQGIKTFVENGKLRIFYDGEKAWGIKNKKLKVYVSFKNIDKIDAAGASDVFVAGSMAVNTLNLHFSGASEFRGSVKVNELELDLSGASDIKISGMAASVRIASSGASDIKGYGLVTDICNATASGASDINITVNKELNANASGASHIYYMGAAMLKELHSSGASNVERKG